MQRYLLLALVIPLLCFFLQSCEQQHKPQKPSLLSANPHLNKELGSLFLAKNKLKPGVTTLPSGLQYHVIQTGVGMPPKASDLVTVYYQGAFIDGKVFDATHLQRSPVTIRVSAVIPGWQQALQMMQPGAIWVIYVPPSLAYGEKGVPGLISPDQTLIYTVNLVGYKKG